MKHLKLFFALFAMLALGVGNAWGAETLYKTALFGSSYNSKKVSSYTDTWTATNNGFTVTVVNANNNNNGWAYIKMGRKSALSVGSITTQNALDKPISKITMTIDAVTAKNINSIKLKTSTDGSSFVEAGTFTISKGEQSVTINNPTANLYYQIEVDCKTGSNGSIQISKVQYYATEDAGGSGETVVSVPTFSVPEGTFYSPINVELSCETADAEIHYTLDGSTPTSTSEKYTTAIAISETTTVKAIAVKDGLTDSEVATATYTKGETVTSYDIDFETNALEAYVNWDFSNITIAKTITAKGGTYYGNTSVKASASIKTKTAIQYPGTLTFYTSKESNNTTSSNWIVQVSENGSTWTEVTSFDATTGSKGTWTERTADLSDYENVYVQISYSGSTAIRAIDEISLAQGVAPVKYILTIEKPENGTLSVTKGGASVASGDEFKAGTSLVVTPTPATGYVFESLTVGGEAVELTDGTYTFNMPAADVTIAATFKENEKPAATLTLSKNGVTEDITGYKQDDKVILPSITSDCVKEFVGWSANPTCNVEPEYKDGDEYTLASTTQTLYAVYATVDGGGETTASVNMATYATANSWGSTSSTNQKQITINSDVKAVISAGGNSGKYYNDGVRIYQSESATVTISTTVGELKSVKFTFTNSSDGTLLYGSTKLTSGIAVEVSGTSAVFSVGDTNASENKGQIRFTAIEVTYASAPTYSNYSTTCAAALEKPTFSVAEGTYTEAKSIELNATEGDVYYTLDGTEPTKSSTPYTAAIDLDECGTTTIKAIAINTESQSPVASATYTINLPITNTAETAYTPTEAIAIIDGACDKTEEVFVKGVVVSTSAFNATYGNYDVIVKAVDDNSATPTTFTFYRMYKAASNTKFTESDEVIGVGDIITAKGVLKKHNSTYELAEGCYMVERVAFTEPKTDISNTFETAYTVDKAFELISDVKSDLDKEVYVKGLVAVASTELYEEKYLTYSISDNGQNTGNVLKVYDGLDIGGVAFTSKDDVKVGDYVVVKGKLLNYKGTYEINKDNQLVQHKKAATITIADITMEVGETKTIAATITPAAAETAVTYTIKENAADAISLSGNTITANSVGTATITATIATAADYMGKTVDFKVTVNAKSTKEKVVILAEYEGQWYALKAQYVTDKTSHLAPLPVTYFDGKLYNVNEADKALIEWERAIVDGKATFSNNNKYLTGKSDKTDLTLAATACEWTVSGDSYLIGARTFLYNAENNWFRNFGTSNAGNKNYSDMPTVTAPVYATGDIVYSRDVTPGNYGTICLPYASDNFTGATFFEVAGKEGDKVFFDEVTTLEAGKPYIFMAEETEIKVTQVGDEYIGNAQLYNSLQGTFTQINPAVDNVLVDNYMVVNNVIKKCGVNCGLQAYRAYFIAGKLETLETPSAPAPSVRRISMGVTGQNTATGVDQVQGDNVPTKMIINGQLFILRGEKMYDAQGKLVK